jgi:adenylate cyclase class IV
MKFNEIEYKYNASEIDQFAFNKKCEELGGTYEYVRSFDSFYKKINSTFDDLCYIQPELQKYNKQNLPNIVRHRFGNHNNELTLKQGVTPPNDKNSTANRIEINLQLSSETDVEMVNAFYQLLGYQFDYKILKKSHIFDFGDCELVYYIVYSVESKRVTRASNEKYTEIGRYIEIEAKSDNLNESFKIINKYEKILGFNQDQRLNKSLYELCKLLEKV